MAGPGDWMAGAAWSIVNRANTVARGLASMRLPAGAFTFFEETHRRPTS